MKRLIAWLKTPDFIIGSSDNPYLKRWYITPWSGWFRTDAEGNPIEVGALRLWQRLFRVLPNVYVHQILQSDDDRALHDHPWWNVSIILSGGYYEVMPDDWNPRGQVATRRMGNIIFRRATAAHRLQLRGDYRGAHWRKNEAEIGHTVGGQEWHVPLKTCWSLFITGPRVREWGFHCPNGWVKWTDFTKPTAPGEIGRGCGE